MKKLIKWVNKDPLFPLFILLTIILAIFFRTYNYFDRVNVHADNSWLLQVARYAFDNLKIPQVGPFSSAGPFFYGPWWFWIFGLLTVLPFGFLTHWYVMTFLSLVFIYLIFWIGREMGGKWLGTISALYAAISTAQIDNSMAVWSPALIPFLVALSLVFLIRFSKGKKALDLFILAFVLGLSITIHFQSILLSPELVAAIFLIFSSKPKPLSLLKYLGVMALGFIIPFLPLIYFDMRHNWYDTISLAVFLLVDQYKIWVPNRWLTYLGSYWPEAWAGIIGGSRAIGGLTIVLVAIFGGLRLKSFKKYEIFYLVAVTFLFEVILFRYYRGERFYYYSLFAHPAVIVLTAFVTWELFKFNKYLGLILGAAIVFFTLQNSIVHLKTPQITLGKINAVKNEIYAAYPDKNFDIYGCIYNGNRISHPLALSMYMDGRNSLDGVKIGACETPDVSLAWHELLEEEYSGQAPTFENYSTERVYRGTVEWWKEKSPGRGDLWKFLRENLRKN